MRPRHLFQLPSAALLLGCALFINNPVIAAPKDSKPFDALGTRPQCSCLPDQPCWPSTSTWSAFNDAVGGNLIATTPVARGCHDPYYDKAKCDTIKKGYYDGNWRRSQPGAVLLTNWETFHGQGCLGFNQSMPCNQGAVPIYTVKATSVADVQETIRFASKHNIRLAIKNTGHDFLGRSVAPSSISLWVTSMRKIVVVDNFVRDGAPHGTEGQGAVILESGVLWGEAYKAANDHNVVIVGGDHYSVGAVGGFCLSGGHGPLTPRHGLCVDNVLQFTVVTANGEVCVANDHQNQDLFWALRGGGPGFGVIVEAVYRTYPALKNMIYAQASIFSNDTSSMDKITRDFYSHHDTWSNEGWSGYAYVTRDTLLVQYFLPEAPVEQAKASFNRFLDYACSFPTVAVVNVTVVNHPTFYSVFLARWDSLFGQKYAGINGVLGTRLIPRILFQSNPGIDLLTSTLNKVQDDITSVFPEAGFFQQFVGGGQVARGSSLETSVQPAWRDTLMVAINVVEWDDKTSYANQLALQRKLTKSVGRLRAITPGGGTYQGEADPNEPNWQQSFFGANYPRLRTLKDKYDPSGIFVCRHCVGSEDWDTDLMCRRH